MGHTWQMNSGEDLDAIRQRTHTSFDKQGLMKSLGARLGLIEPGEVHIHLPMSPNVTQHHGYFHAGVSTMIGDNAAGYAAGTLMRSDQTMLTVELKVNFLSPGIGQELEAVGKVVKDGKTLTVCTFEVFANNNSESKLIALGQQTLIKLPRNE